jgi:hypothetical protein
MENRVKELIEEWYYGEDFEIIDWEIYNNKYYVGTEQTRTGEYIMFIIDNDKIERVIGE